MIWPILHTATSRPPAVAHPCMQDLANLCHAHAGMQERDAAKKRLDGFHKWARDTLTSGPAPHTTRLRTWTHTQ
eukprot:2775578-Pyramimonas_sp.AAC.1